MPVHTKEKNFECKGCARRFTQGSSYIYISGSGTTVTMQHILIEDKERLIIEQKMSFNNLFLAVTFKCRLYKFKVSLEDHNK